MDSERALCEIKSMNTDSCFFTRIENFSAISRSNIAMTREVRFKTLHQGQNSSDTITNKHSRFSANHKQFRFYSWVKKFYGKSSNIQNLSDGRKNNPPNNLSEKLSSGLLVCPTPRNLNSIAYHEEGTRVKPSPRLTYLFCCKTNGGKQKVFKTQLIMYQEMEGKQKEPIKFVTIDQKEFLRKTESRYCCLDQEGMLVYDLANKITLLLCSYMYVVVCLASPRI